MAPEAGGDERKPPGHAAGCPKPSGEISYVSGYNKGKLYPAVSQTTDGIV